MSGNLIVYRHSMNHSKDCCSQELQITLRWTFNFWVSLDRPGDPEHWGCRHMPPCLDAFVFCYYDRLDTKYFLGDALMKASQEEMWWGSRASSRPSLMYHSSSSL